MISTTHLCSPLPYSPQASAKLAAGVRLISPHYSPPKTQAFLERVRACFVLGVITSSPRPYAEKLLSSHRVDLPVLAAYHDSKLHKPHPAPLLYAAAQVGIPPEQCIYMGDTTDDLLAAWRAHMIPLGLSWNDALPQPPATARAYGLCRSWDEALVCLWKLLKKEKVPDAL